MKRRRQQGVGCLLVLLLLAGFASLQVWRELRRAQLSAQLIATIKKVYSVSDIPYSDASLTAQQRENLQEHIRRDETRAIQLLREGANPNARDFPEVHRTFWEEAKFLLKQAFRRSAPDTVAMPPSALAIAVEADSDVLVTALLKAGAIIAQDSSDTKFSLVGDAVHNGNPVIIREMCAHGADIRLMIDEDDPTGENVSLLLDALQSTDLVASDLVASGDEERAKAKYSPAIERERRMQVFHLLVAQGAKYTPNSEGGYDLLCSAAEGDFFELARELLAAGAPPNAAADGGSGPEDATPLSYAVMNGDLPLVKLLLQHGASVKEGREDERMESLLFQTKSPEIAALLLAHGADRHAVRKQGKYFGENLLTQACRYNDRKMVAFWVAHGIDVNAGNDGVNAIETAALYGDMPMVRLLLEHGAKVGSASPGKDALWAAIAESHFDSARLLLHYGAAVNAKDDAPLTEAAKQDSIEMAQELLERGADVNAERGAALLAACEACDEDLVELLLEHGAKPNVHTDSGAMPAQFAKEAADPPTDADGIIALLKQYGAKR